MKRIPLGDGSALAGATVAAPLFDGGTENATARAAVKTRRPSEKPFKSRPVPRFSSTALWASGAELPQQVLQRCASCSEARVELLP